MLILDDAQWADQDTLSLVGPLARRVKLLIGIRAGDPGASGIQNCALEHGFALIAIAPLAMEESKQVARYWSLTFTMRTSIGLLIRPGATRS